MSPTIKQKPDYSVQKLTTIQARRLFDEAVQRTLDITSDEFISRYQAGKYEDCDDCDIRSILMLLPFTGYSAEYAKKQNRRR